MTDKAPDVVAEDEVERAQAYDILQKHLATQGYGGSQSEKGYFYRRDQLAVKAMIEFAALASLSRPLPEDLAELIAELRASQVSRALCKQAADALTTLHTENERKDAELEALRNKLRPRDDTYDHLPDCATEWADGDCDCWPERVEALRRRVGELEGRTSEMIPLAGGNPSRPRSGSISAASLLTNKDEG